MNEPISIFVESNEDMGLLYNSYIDLIDDTDDFLEIVSSNIKKLNQSPAEIDLELEDDINTFREKILAEKIPDPIDLGDIKGIKSDLKGAKNKVDKILSKYVKEKDKIAYGGNYLRAILVKPKVYHKEIDPEAYERINRNIRLVNLGMDWVEKALIDISNMIDQDANILTIVDKVYNKHHIYESIDEEIYIEASNKSNFRSTKYWHKECQVFHKLFHKDLNELGDIKTPKEKISIVVGNQVKMTFKTSRGNIPNSEKKVAKYAQVPTAIHLFNVHKDDIIDDKIGIDKAILDTISLRDDDFDISMSFSTAVKQYQIKPKKIIFNLYGTIGLTFTSNLPENEGKFGVIINTDMKCRGGDERIVLTEAVGDADDGRPASDHPIQDTFQDIDRGTVKLQQKAKKAVQNVQNTSRAIMKPVNRTKNWLTKIAVDWKDKNETEMKEKMADPHSRNALLSAFRKAIRFGALFQAGLLLNPIFWVIGGGFAINNKSKEFRIRNEMIGELKMEIEIINKKIQQADYDKNYQAKYKLMRLKNEIQKKLLRVGGTKEFKKII